VICRPGTGISSARPTQQQIAEFLNFAKTAELGPIVFILMQNLVSTDWQRKSRALLVIHELIENDFPLVREYFNEEGKDTLNALADDPQIRNLILQIFSDLKKPRNIIQPDMIQPYDNYITPKQPDQNQETEGSLFASLEITEQSTPNNTIDITSQNSQFDFIDEGTATPHVPPLDIDPFSTPSLPPQELIKSIPEPEIIKPPQDPVKSNSSQLPASVFSALAQLPDAKPQTPGQNDHQNLFVNPRPTTNTGSNLFADLGNSSKSNLPSTSTFQVPETTSTSLFTTPTPTVPTQQPYPPAVYPYPYPYPYYPPTNYPYQMPYPPTYPYPQVPPTQGAQNPQNLFK